MKHYGFYFAIDLRPRQCGIWIQINGRMYSAFRGVNSGKFQCAVWDNIYRKSRTYK